MKSSLLAFVLASACALSAADTFRQTYPLDPDKVRQNEIRVNNDLKNVPQWEKAPFLYYTVDPMSSIKRLPDTFPVDGTLCGTLGIVAAQNEYEPASFVVYPRKNADRFTFTVSDLKSEEGNIFPAAQLDLKLLKVWYQTGSSWYGYFADALNHVLCPELLVNDENLVRVVANGRGHNYVRYYNEDGSIKYWWMTAPYTSLDYQYLDRGNLQLIRDADTLQPVVLNKNEFKQFFLTAYVPEKQKPGLYTGSIKMTADGVSAGEIAVRIRVLPFELPEARTYHDFDREFFLCLYGTNARLPKVLKNLSSHNMFHPKDFPIANPFYPERFKADVQMAKENGIHVERLMDAMEGCGLRSVTADHKRRYAEAVKLVKSVIGKDAEIYSYGMDEGDFYMIKKQRDAWDAIHEAGANVMVSSLPHQRIQYGLDYVAFAFPPVGPWNEKAVADYHRMNPKALVGWYANPHSGPENPDYFRRMHGYVAYRNGFDASSNYSWWRNNWNDFSITDEHNMRGLIMVYATRDDVLDTIEWEGVREGIDDIRYITLMLRLARKANESKDWATRRLARNAMSFIAYSDPERDTITPIRMECISYILKLRTALEKGDK